MRLRFSATLAGASLFVIGLTLAAQAQTTPSSKSAQDVAKDTGTEEIIVTARRKYENLQNVPETVDVVTHEQIQDYNIQKLLDMVKLVPGLTLTDGNGFLQTASMRGVDYNQVQATPPTVAFYLNDVLVKANQVFQGFYDIGQVEVLRGPQGTVRGDTAPSGSITLTTVRPDLETMGGYVEGSVGSLNVTNFQGAVGIPIVQDKFAIRIAGIRDENSVNDVRSVFDPTRPQEVSEAGRVTALLKPTDDFSAVVVYQHLNRTDVDFMYPGELYGNGSPGVAGVVPAGFNGPPIGINQLLTTAPGPEHSGFHGDMVQALFDWTFHGQKLSYVGGFQRFKASQTFCSGETNAAPFPCFPQVNNNIETDWSHEVRLSSTEPLFDHLDYTVGYFHTHLAIPTTVNLPPTFLPGAFGSPLNPPVPGVPNNTFALQDVLTTNPNFVRQDAVYGSATYHLDQKTEITGGVRWSAYFHTITSDITFSPTSDAVALPASICGAIGGQFGVSYPGICNVPVNVAPFNAVFGGTSHPIIYNVELSHRFNDDVMAYFKTASAFRASNIDLPLEVATSNPALEQYLFPNNETSKSYEVGAKADLFDKHLQFDIDYYHQIFSNYFYQTQPVYFLAINGPTTSVGSTSLFTNAPAVIDGIEFVTTARVTRDWSITGNFSWANGRLSNASIPCNSSKFNGVVDNIEPTVAQFQAAGQSIAVCKSNASTTAAPRWNLTLQSEYDHSINEALTGFIRGLFYFYPSNPNASPPYVVPAYGIVDLFLGLRAPNSKWEVYGYAKNVFNNQTVTSLGATDAFGDSSLSSFFGPGTGYYSVTHPLPRQVGVTVRYAFGSG